MIKFLDLKLLVLFAVLYCLTLAVCKYKGWYWAATYWDCFMPLFAMLCVLGTLLVLALFLV